MIEKTYRCDLCRESIVSFDDKSAFRLKFTGRGPGGWVFSYLADTSASDTIVCRGCLRKMAEQMELPQVKKLLPPS
jgi:hypothetical protein